MSLKIDNPGDLQEIRAALFDNNSNSGWLLLNYVDASTVHVTAGGEGGPEDLAYRLEDDQIQYALVRLGNIQDKSTLKVVKRDVFITFIGPSVDKAKKDKASGRGTGLR